MTGPVTAVVVDDSPTQRAVLRAVLERAGIDVVGEAGDGRTAVAMVARLRPSVVVMDIDMPGLDGLGATEEIMATTPTPVVVVTASRRPRDVALALEVTRAGALTVQPKPVVGASANEAEARRFGELVRAMADVRVVGRRGRGARSRRSDAPGAAAAPTGRAAGPQPGSERRSRRVRIVGVGASTGGPPALFRFLAELGGALPVPMVVVQHLPESFVEGFVRWLGTASSMPVRLPADHERLSAGVVFLAPPGRHLTVTASGRARLVEGPPEHGFCPSVSVLFRSLAEAAGAEAAAVVLTGMGTDGLDGTRAVHAAGGRVLVQDEESSAVFGMPKAVTEAGLADTVGCVEALAAEIVDACNREES